MATHYSIPFEDLHVVQSGHMSLHTVYGYVVYTNSQYLITRGIISTTCMCSHASGRIICTLHLGSFRYALPSVRRTTRAARRAPTSPPRCPQPTEQPPPGGSSSVIASILSTSHHRRFVRQFCHREPQLVSWQRDAGRSRSPSDW